MPVKNKLKSLLEAREISVYRFQRDVGVAQGTAYSLVNNPSQLPSSTVLSKICDAYRIQPNDVLEWIDPEKLSA
jgi:DNA-binding Xre family transcriptional regulator